MKYVACPAPNVKICMQKNKSPHSCKFIPNKTNDTERIFLNNSKVLYSTAFAQTS